MKAFWFVLSKFLQELPKHLLLVNWHKLQDRLEVYQVLDKLSKDVSAIPFHVSTL